jgi:carbamoyl-phosphate synthase large subunit
VSARIFRGYGKNSRDVISRWIRNLLNDEPINVYKPEGLFDYIYAADTAEGLIRLAESTKATGIINLGTGRSRRVSEVIEILRKYFPKLKLIDVESNIPFEASQADMSFFYELIGWLPEYKIENAIHEIINFESARKKNASIILKKSAPVVLVSSSSRKAPLITAIKAAVNRIDNFSRVICGDISPDVLTSFIGDDFWLMPETKDEMLDEILCGCKTRGINIILPTRDGELEFWSTHAKFFASHNIKIIISSIASIRRCVDKKLFSDFGKAQNLSFIPSSMDINFLDASRYVVKERYGAGSRSVGIGLDYKQALDHASKLNYPIFQPFVEGEEFSVDAWANNFHQVKGLVLRRRNLVINGESQITTTFSDTFIENEMKKIIEKLELRGPIVLQAIKDPQGIVHVIECNARFGGASNLGIEAGVDSLFWSIGEAVGLNIDEYPFIRKLTEVRQVRLPSDIYFYDSNF